MKYESIISQTHVDIVNKYNMTTKQILIFGWWCCISEINNEYFDVESQEWFQDFLEENNLS